MLRKKRLEKLSPVKRGAWLHAFTLQNFARRHLFDVNEVYCILMRNRYEKGSNLGNYTTQHEYNTTQHTYNTSVTQDKFLIYLHHCCIDRTWYIKAKALLMF